MSKYRIPHSIALILLLATTTSCATNRVAAVRGTFSFLNTYESVQKDYEHGHIMEARAAALNMSRDKAGYAEAQKLLQEKIEPARLRLLRHYTARAKQEERKGIWFKARDLYNQAATFSIHNASLLKKAKEMDLKVRQLRLNTFIARKRKEDATLLAWLNSYAPPKQVDSQDEPFAHSLETLQDWIDERAHDTYIAAKRNLRLGYPEVAYADIESYLRLEPDSSYGNKLMKQIKEALPKGIRIPGEPRHSRYSSRRIEKKTNPKSIESHSVSAKEIKDLLRQKRWQEAYRAAATYRREGGQGAEPLFQEVDAQLEKVAAAAFKAGRLAFRAEKIDIAVKQWRRAVNLRPDNVQYVENLLRAEQLQERLKILRSESGHNAAGKRK